MRIRSMLLVLLTAGLATAPALAMFSGGKDKTPEPNSNPDVQSPTGSVTTSRQEAEKWYGDAYDDVAKANKELAQGKTKNAEKKFQRGLERGERGGPRSTYHEAELVGARGISVSSTSRSPPISAVSR
jgi:hypothetical protein